MAKTKPLTLSEEERSQLETITRTRTLQAQVVSRARILLLKSDGYSVDAIAEKVDLNRNSVLLCLKKFKSGGIENAIFDAPGRGRNAEITDEEKSWIINIACQKPVDLGYSAETWTYSKLTKHINETAESAGYIRLSTITKTSIKNILDAAEIKPFRIQYYCENRDPDFEAKMHQVLVVYKQLELLFDENGELYIPAGEQEVHTVSYDEKPGIQAIATTSPDLKPNIENGTIKRDYEYKRLGTISLLAAIDLLTGEAIPLVRNTHNSDDFIDFLKLLDERYAAGDTIQIILDNHSVHTSKKVKQFLSTMPGRFVFVFTPKHGSWLNLIEGFFGKMTRQMLRGIRVSSKQELVNRIYQYFDEVNENPVVYHWKYRMDEF
ncbi:MAG: IS630 family transposase [Lachnospiraceae bacterium]|nr:IS630 family transposase [Lachnospiraceae bacterium]